MRLTIVCQFLSLLLFLPSLVASKDYVHSPPQPSHPEHGDIVRYQEHNGGTQHGLVMGNTQGHLYVAPLTHDSPPPGARRPVIPNPGRIVKTLPGHVVKTEHSYPTVATRLAMDHISNHPTVSHGAGPLRGSLNRPR